MKLPRVRFTIRRLMLAVMVAALFLTAMILVKRSRFFASQAALHAAEEAQLKYALGVFAGDPADFLKKEQEFIARARAHDGHSPERYWYGLNQSAEAHQLAEKSEENLKIWRQDLKSEVAMRAKYEWAAAHPWQSVAPDPPEPSAPPSEHEMPMSFYDPVIR